MDTKERKQTFAFFRVVCIGSLLFPLFGCGGGSAPTAAVHGQVTLADKPVGPGIVILKPAGPQPDPPLQSTTLKFGPDGKFDGVAPLGKHDVIIQSDDVAEESRTQSGPPMIPIHYADPAASKLTAEVKNGDNTLNFPLKPMR